MLKYAELVSSNGVWYIHTEAENIEVGKMVSYLTALDEVSKSGWSLVDIVVLSNQSKYIISKKQRMVR